MHQQRHNQRDCVNIYFHSKREGLCESSLSLSLSFRLEMVASRNFYDKTFEIVLQPKDLLTTFTTSIRNQFEQQQQQQQKNHVNFNFLAPLGSTSILSYLIHNSSRILTDEWAHQTISIPFQLAPKLTQRRARKFPLRFY